MACFCPLDAWQLETGEIVFFARTGSKVRRELTLPCGQCIGCRLERSRQWATRIMHEASMHDDNCFVTLTYDDEHVPQDGSLRHRDFQLFMKRLRKRFPDVRYYMCGEYGDRLGRPHFHACLFGLWFSDCKLYRNLPSGHKLYTSAILSEIWTDGFSSVGQLSFDSAAYVARYVMKKVTGDRAPAHYERLSFETGEIFAIEPEYCRMSLKPGIGARWFDKYWREVARHDRVVVNGSKNKPPRYYDKKLLLIDPARHEFIAELRAETALANSADNTYDRLRVRETVTRARLSFKKRVLE